MNINTHFHKLRNNYLFTEIEKRVADYQAQHAGCKLLRMGVGDVTRPLPAAIISAMHSAVEELAHEQTFHGYGPEEGYSFLRQAIIDNDFKPLGVDISTDEIFISEGAGSDLGNLCDLFTPNNTVAVLDPVYPAYVDASVMAGRAGVWVNDRWDNIIYMPCTKENNFIPELPCKHADIIYLCFPNNPTGTALTHTQLKQWVDYALRHKSIIIFDAAYEAYINECNIPHSIYEIEGAKEVAIEVHSFSKGAGFTSIRCGYTIVPHETGLRSAWYRRQCTKYNGTSYISQRAAEATYTQDGRNGLLQNINYYRQNADILTKGLSKVGYEVYGGINSPYLWVKTPDGINSWAFFDMLLDRCQIVCTPGVGFGRSGEGYARFTAFASHDDTREAIRRIKERI